MNNDLNYTQQRPEILQDTPLMVTVACQWTISCLVQTIIPLSYHWNLSVKSNLFWANVFFTVPMCAICSTHINLSLENCNNFWRKVHIIAPTCIQVFWHMMPCHCASSNKHFDGSHCLHIKHLIFWKTTTACSLCLILPTL
jgi:ABC-type polysaccharide/polyol phosphate export permease